MADKQSKTNYSPRQCRIGIDFYNYKDKILQVSSVALCIRCLSFFIYPPSQKFRRWVRNSKFWLNYLTYRARGRSILVLTVRGRTATLFHHDLKQLVIETNQSCSCDSPALITSSGRSSLLLDIWVELPMVWTCLREWSSAIAAFNEYLSVGLWEQQQK